MKTLIKNAFAQVTQRIYQEHGYDDRADYLRSVADELDISQDIVFSVADLLGRSEDFDGLLSMLEGCRNF